MKNPIYAAFTISFLFVFSFSEAQTVPAKLNQLELSNKIIGIWQAESQNDTIVGLELEKFGKAFSGSDFYIVKGTRTNTDKWLMGYSKADDNFKMFGIFQGGGYATRIASFVSEDKFVQKAVRNLDPTKVSMNVEIIFLTPESIMGRFVNPDGNVTGEMKFKKVK